MTTTVSRWPIYEILFLLYWSSHRYLTCELDVTYKIIKVHMPKSTHTRLYSTYKINYKIFELE
jgi:hypothetical protein